MDINNSYAITGVIHDIEKQTIRGKKDPTQTFDKYLITLEVTSSGDRKRGGEVQYATDTQFPQFEAFNLRSASMDDFAMGDLVEIRFFLEGKKYTRKSGDRAGQEGIMQKNVITYIKFADISTLDGGHKTHKGKITVDSTSDTKELEKVFKPSVEEEDEFKDLPFIITALIGISSLMIF